MATAKKKKVVEPIAPEETELDKVKQEIIKLKALISHLASIAKNNILCNNISVYDCEHFDYGEEIELNLFTRYLIMDQLDGFDSIGNKLQDIHIQVANLEVK